MKRRETESTLQMETTRCAVASPSRMGEAAAPGEIYTDMRAEDKLDKKEDEGGRWCDDQTQLRL